MIDGWVVRGWLFLRRGAAEDELVVWARMKVMLRRV